MSTKTTFKRIALVTVAALGFGVLTSVVPANAAATSSLTVSGIARAGVGYNLTFTSDSTTNTTSEYVHWVQTATTSTAGVVTTGSGLLVAAAGGSTYTVSAAGTTFTAGTYSVSYTHLTLPANREV